MPATQTTDSWFRADVIRGKPESVDRKAGVIHGYAVMTKGLTRDSRGVVDEKTLSQVLEFSAKRTLGIKGRFGHPAMSSDALGTFLGRSKNFRLSSDGAKLLADFHFDPTAFKTPSGDLATYTMDLAESAPEEFGASIVVKMAANEPQLDENKNPKKDAPPFLRFADLLASDIVDSPAANHKGLFDDTSVQFSAEMTEFLDQFLSRGDAVERVLKFLGRYTDLREPEQVGTLHAKENDTMETVALTPKEQFAAFLADLKNKFNAAFGEGKPTAAPVAVDATLTSASQTPEQIRQQLAADMKKFTDAFGAENGVKWFNDGKTFEAAQTEHITALSTKITTLENRIKAAKVGETAALSTETDGGAGGKKEKKPIIRIRK